MMRKTVLALLAGFALLLNGCEKERIKGSGPVLEEFRNVPAFTKVSTSGSSNVTIEYGPAFSVKLSGYGNLLPYFETVVENNELVLAYRHGVNISNDNVTVHIVMPTLQGVNISGSADIAVPGVFENMPGLSCNISGSGKIIVDSLTTQNLSCNISGSGKILAFGLHGITANIDISGSGSAEISVESNLNVNISGSGTVYYRGNPVVNSTISGSGRLIHQ